MSYIQMVLQGAEIRSWMPLLLTWPTHDDANDYIWLSRICGTTLAVCPCTVCGLNGRHFYGVRFIILSSKLNNQRSSGVRALLGAVSNDLEHEDEIGSVMQQVYGRPKTIEP